MNQGRDGDPPYTSQDLFGDLVDPGADERDKADKAAEAPKGARPEPIKVRVAEPKQAAAPPPRKEELAGLLAAFDDEDHPAELAKRPRAATAAAAPDSGDGGVPAADPGAAGPGAGVPAKPPAPPSAAVPEGQRDAEAISELLQLTSRLPAPPAEATQPALPLEKRDMDLASVAETALEAAEPAGERGPDAVLPAPPEPSGVSYGPYRLLEKIATGGMADVFKAKRTGVAGFEKVVAVKRILPHLSYNKEFVEMFIDEAKMVAGLHHPNVVQIYDLGRIGASYYIAMEYVPGADLRTILRKLKERGLRMPVDLAMFVVSRVAAGLDHAHHIKDALERPMKIVHRDVSPQNILISFDGEVKLTDFGIAKAATKASTTEKGALRGKLMYMSPEQAWAKPIDLRSDVFSLGIVLYELITDQRPFLGSSDMSLLDRVRQGTVAPPSSLFPGIPPRLERLVMRALEREPAQRLRDAGAMHKELEELLQEPEHAATAKDLARFVRILFDRGDRADTASARTEEIPAGELEVDLEGLDERPAEPLHILTDPMPIGRLLRRFGPG